MSTDAKRAKWAQDTLSYFLDKKYVNSKGETVDLFLSEHSGNYIPESASEQMVMGFESTSQYLHSNIKVQNIGAIEAANELVLVGKTAILNFASAIKPGGGFLSGKQAQEEALARSSNLLFSLVKAPDYYSKNIEQNTPFYTHDMIYSHGVTFIRHSNGDLMDIPFQADVITSPAVNLGEAIEQKIWEKFTWMYDLNEYTYFIMDERIKRVLTIALVNGCENLVLGAWGCGIFKCDPNRIAGLFAKHLIDGQFYNKFKNITFAVLDGPKETLVKAFKINIEDAWNKDVKLDKYITSEYGN